MLLLTLVLRINWALETKKDWDLLLLMRISKSSVSQQANRKQSDIYRFFWILRKRACLVWSPVFPHSTSCYYYNILAQRRANYIKIVYQKPVSQEDVFWQKNKYFDKKPTFVCILKKPNWVPLNGADGWASESTMRYFVIIYWYFDKILHCAVKSQPSAPFSWDSIWLL